MFSLDFFSSFLMLCRLSLSLLTKYVKMWNLGKIFISASLFFHQNQPGRKFGGHRLELEMHVCFQGRNVLLFGVMSIIDVVFLKYCSNTHPKIQKFRNICGEMGCPMMDELGFRSDL